MKLSRMPRSSDDHRTWAPAVRAPPRKIEVTVVGVDPPAFLRAVSQSEVEAMAGTFGNGDARGDLTRLELLVERLDIGELKQFHPIQVPLRVLQFASLVQISGLVLDFSTDHVVADTLIA